MVTGPVPDIWVKHTCIRLTVACVCCSKAYKIGNGGLFGPMFPAALQNGLANLFGMTGVFLTLAFRDLTFSAGVVFHGSGVRMSMV